MDVEAKDIESEVDPEDDNAVIYTIPVPEFSRDANSDVVLSFVGLVSPDGNDYSSVLTATYTSAGFTTGISAINAGNNMEGTLNRTRKKSFYWYKKVIASNGEEL